MSTTAVKKMSPREACKIVIDSLDAAYTHQSDELKRAKQFMRTLADYATPVRPQWDEDGIGRQWQYCPTCEATVTTDMENCKCCGQALKW